MQPPVLVRRQALPLLVEIGAALGPGANARIGTQLRLKPGKGGIGAVVARALAMPRPMPRITRQSIHAIRFFSPSKALSMRLSRAEAHPFHPHQTSPTR